MKKIIYMLLAVVMVFGLSACGSENQEAATEEGFNPSLETSTDCHITVAGGYDNFEALEAEFDSFNSYYPNVELMFTKVDDYNNMIGMAWMETMHLTFTSITLGCMAANSINLLLTMLRICLILRWVSIWTAYAAILF